MSVTIKNVKAGQMLIELDDDDYRAALNQAQAALAGSEAALEDNQGTDQIVTWNNGAKAPSELEMAMSILRFGRYLHPFLGLLKDQVRMILRASPSGSFIMRHSLSQIIVLFVSGSVGDHFRPGMLGFPVAANVAQDAAIFLASACASGVFPVPCSHLLVLSKQN